MSQKDITPPERRKLYTALGRAMEKYSDEIPPAVICRYNSDKESGNLFPFLQEWVKDPRFGCVTIKEEHTKITKNYTETQWGWYTRADLYTRWSGWTSQEGRDHAENMIKKAKTSIPNIDPAHKKDKKMKMYKLLKSAVEGGRTTNEHREGQEFQGQCPAEQAAAAVIKAQIEKRDKTVPKSIMLGGKGDETNKKDKKKKKKKRKRHSSSSGEESSSESPASKKKRATTATFQGEMPMLPTTTLAATPTATLTGPPTATPTGQEVSAADAEALKVEEEKKKKEIANAEAAKNRKKRNSATEAATVHAKIVELKILKQSVEKSDKPVHHKNDYTKTLEECIKKLSSAEDTITLTSQDGLDAVLEAHASVFEDAESEIDFISARMNPASAKAKAKKKAKVI
jgi:hypothetical protein